MSYLPETLADVDTVVGPFPMGTVWGALDDIGRLEVNELVRGMWLALDWEMSPFDKRIVATSVVGVYVIHLRHIAESEATPETAFPDFIRDQLESRLVTETTTAVEERRVLGFPAIYPEAAAAGEPELPDVWYFGFVPEADALTTEVMLAGNSGSLADALETPPIPVNPSRQFFAAPETLGPPEALEDVPPAGNQIGAFALQDDTVPDAAGVPYLVWISNQPITGGAGLFLQLRYDT